ncbi:hypothetical protein Tco_0808816 [Tanacetum coccineum]
MNLPRSGYQELGYANNTNEVRKLLGLTGYYRSTKGGHGLLVPRLKVGMDKTSSPKTKGGNGRLSIPIVRVEVVLQAYLEVARRNGRSCSLDIHPHFNAQTKATKQKNVKAENLKRVIK